MSRWLSAIRKQGIKRSFIQLLAIADIRVGNLAGTDKFGNKYYEIADPEHEIVGN